MLTPHLGRRAFIQQSTAPLLRAGAIGMLGLGLPDFLRSSALGIGPQQAGAPLPSDKSCIFIVQQGGASHIDTLDPKPGAADDIRGPYRPIATAVPGVQIGELLPRLARLSNRYSVIRSMTHGHGGHVDGMDVCLSGQSKPSDDAPFFGSVLAKLRPPRRKLPPYVWLQEMEYDAGYRYYGGGFLGDAYGPLRVGKGLDNLSAPGFRMAAFDPAPGLTMDRLQRRRDLLSRLQTSATPAAQAPEQVFQQFQGRAFDLLTGPEARTAFDLEREPAQVRDRYGRNPLGQNLLMARRLIEAGVRLVNVHAYTGHPPGHKFMTVNCWDMHGQGTPGVFGDSIFGTGSYSLGWVLPRADQAVSALLEDLQERGLLANTLVVLVGEFGRSPQIKTRGGNLPFPGRDHWPACYSALLAGAGIRGGAAYGASDKNGAFVKDSPVSPEAFHATLFHALGIDPETRLVDQSTRPRPVSAGEPIWQLFG